MIGKIYCHLVVIGPALKSTSGKTCWLCKCRCGSEVVVTQSHLVTGNTKSCGCHRDSLLRTHGKSRTPEHGIWLGMIGRCYNEKNPAYEYYGGRGIRICERWRKSFDSFLLDVGYRPTPLHTIDRFPDKNGNYEPNNVRWATRKEQARNTRRNRIFLYAGKERPLVEIAEMLGIPSERIASRLRRGSSFEEAIR